VEEVAEKVFAGRRVRPQWLKPHAKQSPYRSAEALRHPKAGTELSFSATSGTRALPESRHEWEFFRNAEALPFFKTDSKMSHYLRKSGEILEAEAFHKLNLGRTDRV
jgi:hypothetical protein